MSSKVEDFGTYQKRIWDFLLVTNSNFGPIYFVISYCTLFYIVIRVH